MKRACLAVLPLVAACGVDSIEAEPVAASYDFHGPGTVSSRFADPKATYLPRRPIQTLDRLGALTPAQAAVAKRVDGILANRPADGWVSVEELVRAEQADKWPAFLDDEQALFPAIWALMKAPEGKSPDMAAPFGVSRGEDLSTSATSAVPPVLKVAQLPPELQTTARRLERLFDQDSDDDTVAVADAEAAVAQPSAFTAAEVEDLRKIAAFLRASATNQGGRAIVRVPGPGKTDRVLFQDRGIAISASRTVSFAGSRKTTGSSVGSFAEKVFPIVSTVTMKVEDAVDLAIPAGTTLVVVKSDGEQCVYEASRRLPTYEAVCPSNAPVAIELWKAGVRVESAFAKLTSANSSTYDIDLSAYADYDFVLEDGTQLQQVWTRTVKGFDAFQQGNSIAEFTYERAARQVPGVDASLVAKLAPPTFQLPLGRYRTSFGEEVFEVEVRANGVVHAGVGKKAPPKTLERLWPTVGNFGEWNTKTWRTLVKGPNGYEIDRPALRPDGTVLLRMGFPKLTAANRL